MCIPQRIISGKKSLCFKRTENKCIFLAIYFICTFPQGMSKADRALQLGNGAFQAREIVPTLIYSKFAL